MIGLMLPVLVLIVLLYASGNSWAEIVCYHGDTGDVAHNMLDINRDSPLRSCMETTCVWPDMILRLSVLLFCIGLRFPVLFYF